MQDTLQLMERYGFSMVAAIAMGIALYRIFTFVLVGKAEQFTQSHKELHDMQIKTLERLTALENEFSNLEGKLEIISEYVKKKMME